MFQQVLRPTFWHRCRESRRCLPSLPKRLFEVSQEVQASLKAERPIIALETTIITHGMPYPQNLETALKVEDIVRKNNAAPATIGVIDGEIHIGMDQDKLEDLASRQKNECVKISRRDLPFVVSKKLTGGTTVAATMILANKAGIDIFVTGGVGGVHRDGENSMDISADLIELSKTPMTVVSAGIKSILDIGRTLEFLRNLFEMTIIMMTPRKNPHEEHLLVVPHNTVLPKDESLSSINLKMNPFQYCLETERDCH